MIQFTNEEIETIKDIINEWGSDCPGTDYDKVKELQYKLGLRKRPTPEEIAERERRQKEFNESPLGKLNSQMFARTADHIAAELLENERTNVFLSGEQWDKNDFKIGSQLRIRLPQNYIVTNTKLTLMQRLRNCFKRK